MIPDVVLTILGWILLAAGAAAAVWYVSGDGWFWRRERPRRCPKCWYDLSRTPGLTCSECGFAASSEEQLHKPHRHKRRLILACLILVSSWLAFKGPGIKARGWFAAVPTTAFILFFEHLELAPATQSGTMIFSRTGSAPPPAPTPTWKTAGGEEVLLRYASSAWAWQRWLFLYRASKVVDPLGASRTNLSSGKTVRYSGLAPFGPGRTSVAEELLHRETRADWSVTRSPSSHAWRVWNRIMDDVVVTSAHGPVGPQVSIDVQDSLWIHAQSKWRAILIWVEGSNEPCLAALVTPIDAGRWQIEDFESVLVPYPPDGVLHLRVQLTAPSPPRTDVALADHTVLWEKRIDRRVEFSP